MLLYVLKLHFIILIFNATERLTNKERIVIVYTDRWFVWRCGMARNKYPEETVKLILDAATHLFVEKGYDATSLQDIINETNLSKGAIYHHFSSKEEIFEAISYRIGEENAADLAKVRDDPSLNGL